MKQNPHSVVQFLQRVCLSPIGWNSHWSGRRKRKWGSNCCMNRIFSPLKCLFCQILSLAQILWNNKRTLHCHFSLKAHRFQISLFPVPSLLSFLWNFINACSPLYALTQSLCLLALNLLKVRSWAYFVYLELDLSSSTVENSYSFLSTKLHLLSAFPKPF